jgi:hypothetical protein
MSDLYILSHFQIRNGDFFIGFYVARQREGGIMRNLKDHLTPYLLDPWEQRLGPKRLDLLKKSWAGLFREHLLPELPVSRIASRFHDCWGRPSKELYTAVGAVILQQVLDLSDEEVTHELAFSLKWHYALDITTESDDATFMCPRTVWNFRQMATKEELDAAAFESITAKIIKVFDVDTSKQRLDSTHIFSNMKKLGRVGIFARTIKGFLTDLQRRFPGLFEKVIPEELRKRYLGEKGLGCFSRVKPSEADRTLKTLSEDLLFLVESLLANESVAGLKSFHLLQRVLSEQCVVSGEGEERKVEVRPAKDVASDSLQNPSDPDATYDGHKGQGYQAQVMETYTPDTGEGEKKDETKPEVITYVKVEQAHVSDAHALMPALESTQERGCAPEEVLADALYGSDENVEAAAKIGVEVVSPTMGSEKKEGKLDLRDFVIDEKKGKVLGCPAGQTSQKTKQISNEREKVYFDIAACQVCPNRERCLVRVGKHTACIVYTPKNLRLAVRRQKEDTDAFRDRYRLRAGEEGTMSRYKSQMGVGRLRVRGFENVRFAAVIKALGINILRAARAMAAILRRRAALEEAVKAAHSAISSALTPYFWLLDRLLPYGRPKILWIPNRAA